METPNSTRWPDLPVDILRSLFERLSYIDFHRAKMVCSNWYLCSKQTLGPKGRSPLLLLSPEEGGCRLYNPEEDRVYVPRRDFSGCRFLGNSGKWFLVADSQSNLYIVDVFSEEKIYLPRLELVSKDGCVHNLEPLGDGDFEEMLVGRNYGIRKSAEELRGRVWVDDKTGDYVVVCRFDRCDYMRFCKKGVDRYSEIQTRVGVNVFLKGQDDMVLNGYNLYVFTPRCSLRNIDLSGKDGFEDVTKQPMFTWYKPFPSAEEKERMIAFKPISESYNIAVTRSGEVLLVHNYTYESTTTFEKHRTFGVYKRQLKHLEDPETSYKPWLVEVDSLGDEALFLDLGITLPADATLGIEPNSIYFTRDDRFRLMPLSFLDICVYNLVTKSIKRFPTLSSKLKLKDAQWFIPS
ncbi:hypothetical protein BRARA_F02655 [Brassica rapa]|uniref:F-box domain-containing protein n=1 Tax=Brassica campestris TaxID=3711 RepID=A0A397ZAY9_BRACM|nr:hypothetical protein BRARA_F02655 [Brassica rapa]